MIICFVYLNLVLKIVLYLFNRELLLRFISPSQAVQTHATSRTLNAEGKLFFSILSKRLEKHIYSNNLINSSTYKGCMEKVPGCWELMSVVWDELKLRKTEKSNIATIWLDMANAYGSLPHQLLFFALRRYVIPEHWVSLSIKYYEGLWSISWSDLAPSSWHHHLSTFIILLLSPINVIIEHTSAVTEDVVYKTMTSTPVKGFMDDKFLMSPSIF